MDAREISTSLEMTTTDSEIGHSFKRKPRIRKVLRSFSSTDMFLINQLGAGQEESVPLSGRDKFHVIWFCVIYFGQGFINAYDLFATLYLRFHGVSFTGIGIISGLSKIPVLFRIPIGLVSDKYNFFGLGYRVPYILLGLLVTIASLIGLAFLEILKFDVFIYTALYLVVNVFYTMFDGVLDGFATEVIHKSNAGLVQGAMNCSRGFGLVVSLPLFGILSASIGWQWVFIMTVGALVAGIALVPGVRELSCNDKQQFDWSAFKMFKKRRIQLMTFFTFFVFTPSSILFLMLPNYLEDILGFSSDESGIWLGGAAMGLVIFAPLTGFVVDKYRVHFSKLFALNLAFGAFICACFIVGQWVTAIVLPITVLGGGYVGSILACQFSLIMLLAKPSIASSFFAIQVTVYTVGEIVAVSIAGYLKDIVGYGGVFTVALAIALFTIPFVFLIFPKNNEQADSTLCPIELIIADQNVKELAENSAGSQNENIINIFSKPEIDLSNDSEAAPLQETTSDTPRASQVSVIL
eukprot:708849_1